MLTRCCLVFALLGLPSSQSSTAQSPAWTIDGPAFSATPGQIQSAAAAIKPESFAEATVLFERERYALDAQGRQTHTHQLLYRIEDKAGVEDWDQSAVDWDPWYQGRPAIKARVIQADGHVLELDPRTLTDVPAKNEEEETFSDSRIYKGPLPGVAIGAIVEVETVVVDKLPFFSGGNVYRAYFSRNVPVLRSQVIFEAPADAPFHTALHLIPGAAVHTEQAGNLRRTTVDLYPVPVSTPSDINLATDEDRVPFIEYATGSSWASVTKAYQELAEPHIQPDRAKSLLPPGEPVDSLAYIQALVSRLHKEIRYTGIEFGEAALQPETPTEILKRHYGDCKDKAALLVAMLRASGIPAHMALLSTGPGLDVNPDLPGMSQFDHAIVHVPASANGRTELWIDATAEFMRVGSIPYADTGRRALIIADGTTTLTRIPEARPDQNTLVETREFRLKQYGPAHVVETSATTGEFDSDYRYRYGGAETKATHDDLVGYSKRTYAAKALAHVEHGDGADMTKPFALRLDIDEAARGSSSVIDAAVAIPPAGPIDELPSWFFKEPPSEGSKLTPEQKADQAKAEQNRSSVYLIRPFVTEWRYRILLPEGFVVHSLPPDETIQLGGATLMRHYAVETAKDGDVVQAVYHFDTVKLRYTKDEVLAARKAALELEGKNYILLQFDQAGAKLLAEGKVREGLAADRALIAAHPQEPLHHVQMASALLNAGLGEAAQKEATLATTLDPRSAVAFFELGETMEHNSIGVRLGKGFHRKEALEAYIRSKQLNPDENSTRVQLAILYEHDEDGDRYTETANLKDAIREYREFKKIDTDLANEYEDSLLFALFYDQQFAEVLSELGKLPTNATRDALGVAATAALKGSPAGIERAALIAGDRAQKASALQLSSLELIYLRMYAPAADLLEASIQGTPDAATSERRVQIFRNLKRIAPAVPPASDPTGPVQLMFVSMTEGTTGQEVPHFLARHAFADDAEWKQAIEHNDVTSSLRVSANQAQLPMAVMRDLILGNAKYQAQGDDARGYAVALQSLGAATQNLFVSREDGQYRIVADTSDQAEVGNYALYLVAQHRDLEARRLLDWKRELVHRGGGDDPLEGNLFARFWTGGSEKNANIGTSAIQIAALALTVQKANSRAPIQPALDALKAAPESTDLILLAACAEINAHNLDAARPLVEKLLQQFPDSITALKLAGETYQGLHQFRAWSDLIKTRLAARPADHDLLVEASREAEEESNFTAARGFLQQVFDAGKGTANDYNNYAWSGLFDNHIDAKVVEYAEQANVLKKSTSFPELHTLACIYAAEGKTAEARQLLANAMTARNLAEPDEEVWFGFALVYEQFGEKDAAIAAFRKVKKPEGSFLGATETYVAAQTHLKMLGAS